MNLLPVYFSKQHGAYLSLISAWVIVNLITGFNLMQVVTIIYLLSGLNFVELLTEKFYRKSRLPLNKISWLWIYGFFVFFGTVYLLLCSAVFKFIFLILSIASIAYLILFKKREQKSVVAEWLTFLMISVASFSGTGEISISVIIPVVLSLAVFFGSSIFTVKARFKKIQKSYVVLYIVFSIVLLLSYFSYSTFSILISVLLLLKTSGAWLFTERFSRFPIRTIGAIESAFQVFLIVIFYFFY